MKHELKVPHLRFEEQSLASKNAIAVFSENKTLTYTELNQQANQLAHYLIHELQVAPGEVIGVCTQHEPERVLSLLAVSKASATYVPIDPHYPADLINYMTNKIGAKFILTDRQELLDQRAILNTTLVDLSDISYAGYSSSNLPHARTSKDPMYIIFTSGSTGLPKAVAVSHEAAYNTFSWVMNYTEFKPSDIWLQTINPSFDGSLFELVAPLLVGGKIALIGGTKKLDCREIINAIIRHQVTHILCVPTMLTLLINTPLFSSCHSLKQVFVGAEIVRPALAEKAMSLLPKAVFHNVYGPTEATIISSGWRISQPGRKEALPIGSAISNMKYYLRTDAQEIVELAPGIEGELCISGLSLANGYVNDENLSNEAFIQNPLELDGTSIYRRLYLSGDRCRVDERGDLFCLGRLDGQVKINGHRVELAQVEQQFSRLENVQDVAALKIHDDLIVAVVPCKTPENAELWTRKLHDQIETKLPRYMQPKRIKIIDAIPQTISTKADRKKLMEVLTSGASSPAPSQSAPLLESNNMEQTIASIMTEVTANPLEDECDFNLSFADLGLDSVNLQMLALRLSDHYKVDIRTEVLFEHYTIEKLSTFIKNHHVAN